LKRIFPIFLLGILFTAAERNAAAQTPFLGEDYSYKLTYLGVSAVHISISVPEMIDTNGKRVYRVEAIARTTGLFSPFYTLENRYETYIDSANGLPVRFEKKIHQKTLDQTMQAEFDQSNHVVTYRGGKFANDTTAIIQEDCHNLFSMIYYLRRHRLERDKVYRFNLDIETEPWTAEVRVVNNEVLDLADRKWDAVKVAFQFRPVKDEFKRKHTDILTRRVVNSKTNLFFWIGTEEPYPFLKVEYEMSPFSTYTQLTEVGEKKN